MEVVTMIAGGLLGFVFFLITALLAAPFYAHLLVNRGDGKKSSMHFFTFLEEGEAKIIERGERPVRVIMSASNLRFKREGKLSEDTFWEVVKREELPDRAQDMPYDDCHWLVRLWAKYVYDISGAVFTGIYPFQKVREYQLRWTHLHNKEAGEHTDSREDRGLQIGEDKGKLWLEVKEGYSDHYRVREFIYPMRIGTADTQDKVPLDIWLNIVARVTNPFKAAYAINRWDIRLVSTATNTVTNFARTNPLDKVLSAENAEQADALRAQVLKDEKDKMSGFDITDVELANQSPAISEEDKRRLYSEALAKPEAEARKIKGKAEAQVVRDMNEAVTAGGDSALEIARIEANRRAATDARGGATVFMHTGSGGRGAQQNDDVNGAVLATLQRIEKKLTPAAEQGKEV